MNMFLKPDYIFSDLTQLKAEHLEIIGVKGLVFDLDNTLLPPHTQQLQGYVAQWLDGLCQAGFPYIVVSNNKDLAYLKQAEHLLNVPVLGPAKKPSTRMIKQAIAWLKLPPEAVAVIGDRPLTDLWSGQRAGCKTILVDPLMRANEHGIIHLLRTLERLPVSVPKHTKEQLHSL
jgi:HAD superfamily phosphatase (TIGR01668 family)